MSVEDLNDSPNAPVLSASPASPGAATEKPQRSPRRYKKPAYLNTMTEAEKEANLKVIDNMNKRLNYLKNPRYKTEMPHIPMSTVTPPSHSFRPSSPTSSPARIPFQLFRPWFSFRTARKTWSTNCR